MVSLARKAIYRHFIHFSPLNDAVARIGFAQSVYLFPEPMIAEQLITDVIVVRETPSEQIFLMVITVSNPSPPQRSATLFTGNEDNYDYRLTTGTAFTLLPVFPSTVGNVTFPFFLSYDEVPEGEETFLAVVMPVDGSPTFDSPITTTVFAQTGIRIVDDDGMYVSYNQNVPCDNNSIAEVGFEPVLQ